MRPRDSHPRDRFACLVISEPKNDFVETSVRRRSSEQLRRHFRASLPAQKRCRRSRDSESYDT